MVILSLELLKPLIILERVDIPIVWQYWHIFVVCGVIEVVADDTPSIESVLKADTKRTALLEEEKILTKEAEAGNTKNSERLKEVGNCFVYK